MKSLWVIILLLILSEIRVPNTTIYFHQLESIEVCSPVMSNKEIIYSKLERHYVQKEGHRVYLTKKDIAAVMGNLWGESNYRPDAVNPTSGAYGIAQWLGHRKELLFETYGEKPSLNNQITYLLWEMEYHPYESKQWKKVIKQEGLIDKTWAFCKFFERPSPKEIESSIKRRIREAKTII